MGACAFHYSSDSNNEMQGKRQGGKPTEEDLVVSWVSDEILAVLGPVHMGDEAWVALWRKKTTSILNKCVKEVYVWRKYTAINTFPKLSGKLEKLSYSAFPHTAVLSTILCHSIDVNKVVMRGNSQEITI